MLTDLLIKKQTVPEKRREIPDGKISGLYLVVQPSSGAKSWALRYRVGGLPRKLTLGPYPAVDLATARRKAQEALGDVASGKDPAALKTAARVAAKREGEVNDRVADVATVFIERYVKRQVGDSWARETERLLKVEIIPTLGAKRLGEVKRSDIHDLLDAIVDRGSGYTANRTLAVLRRMFNWAIERGVVDATPVEKIKAPAAETARDRILSDTELSAAWRAFEAVGWPFGRVGQLLLLSGARRDEIAEGRWSEIDLDAKTWTIAKERSKNGAAHEIPLSDAAVAVIAALPRIGAVKDGFVFTTTGRSAISGWSRARAQIGKAMLAALGEDTEAPPAWVLHDLRRTVASGMAGIGIAPHVVEAVLNHKSGTIKGVAAVYNRYSYAAEKRQALDAWARRLEGIVSGSAPSNVVALAGAKAEQRTDRR